MPTAEESKIEQKLATRHGGGASARGCGGVKMCSVHTLYVYVCIYACTRRSGGSGGAARERGVRGSSGGSEVPAYVYVYMYMRM